MDRLPATIVASPAPQFDALVAQGLQLLPALAPEWTDHNPSDPGITLVELLAFFSEALLYRVGRVSLASRLEFLRLLRGGAGLEELEVLRRQGAGAVHEALERTADALSHLDCAVTPKDHERLARDALADVPHGVQASVRCLPDTDLDRAAMKVPGAQFVAGADRGHLSLVVVPPPDCARDIETSLVEAVRQHLEPRRLLTCQIHVVLPERLYLGVHVRATVCPGVDRAALAARVAQTLSGWRPQLADDAADHTLALSEIADRAALVDGVEGVEGVTLVQLGSDPRTLHEPASAVGLQIGLRSRIGHDTWLSGQPPATRERLVRDRDGALAAIALWPWEMPRVLARPQDIAWANSPRVPGGAS